MSLRVLPIWLGSSSFSVTAWLRRSNRCLRFSTSSCFRCSVSFSRISLAVMTASSLHFSGLRDRVATFDEPARDRHLVGHARKALFRRHLVHAGDLEHHR